MKSFVDSLRHACKVPNTDQPFGCVDLMYLATLLDKLLGILIKKFSGPVFECFSLLGLRQGSFLRSSRDVGNGFGGGWPLAAAFHVYSNGL